MRERSYYQCKLSEQAVSAAQQQIGTKVLLLVLSLLALGPSIIRQLCGRYVYEFLSLPAITRSRPD